jgi:DNA-binding LytR/AlgR family response regulator
VIAVKCTVIIDSDREEEIIVYLKEHRPIAQEITEIAERDCSALVGYIDGRVTPLKPSDIYCVASESGRLYALTDSGKHLLKARMYTVEEQLGGRFVKINQSCTVNVDKIERFDVSIGGALRVTLKNGFRDHVSRRQLKAVKERMGIKL